MRVLHPRNEDAPVGLSSWSKPVESHVASRTMNLGNQNRNGKFTPGSPRGPRPACFRDAVVCRLPRQNETKSGSGRFPWDFPARGLIRSHKNKENRIETVGHTVHFMNAGTPNVSSRRLPVSRSRERPFAKPQAASGVNRRSARPRPGQAHFYPPTLIKGSRHLQFIPPFPQVIPSSI
jgi:hypothetical protein